MTNVPTIGGLLLLVAIFTLIPFWTAFLISYVVYRRLRIGLLGGITGIVSFIFTVYLLDSTLWIRGIIAGVFGGTILAILASRFYKPSIPEFKADRRIIVSILIIAGLLLSVSLYYSSAKADLEFSVNDPYGDISYSGYTKPKLSGHDSIDILKLESRLVEGHLILEMELAGEIDMNNTAEYTFMIATEKHSLWTDSISQDEMEVEGSTLRARIPVNTLKDCKVFHVLAVASEYDASVDLNLSDGCSNRGSIWDMLSILTS